LTIWDFARAAGDQFLEQADWGAALGTALAATMTAQEFTLIPGAGVIWYGDQLSPSLLIDARTFGKEPGSIVPLTPDTPPGLWEVVVRALRGERFWLRKVLVRTVTPLELQLSPGDPIQKPKSGRAGCQVQWNNGRGFVTAGHVAPTGDVYDSSGKVGKVAWANNPVGHGTAIEPDISVIDCEPGITVTAPIHKSTIAGPKAIVTVKSSLARGTIMGYNHYVYLHPPQDATLGETYHTDAQVTQPGDSGSVVLLGSELVGHVIGASKGVCSYFQAVDYQLREATARGGLTGLRL
jgi:hypothetical protein